MEIKCLLLACLVSVGAEQIVRSSNSFTNNLYNVLPDKDKNVVFSPLSLHSVLSLTYQGAAGETARIFQNSLDLPKQDVTARDYRNVMKELNASDNITIAIANKIYLKSGYKLKEGFRSVAQNDFRADVDAVDFARPRQAADNINGWVTQRTNGKITNLVSAEDFDQYTRTVLLNAIYFKGRWSRKFNKADTRTEKFYVSERESVDCEMMHQTDHYYYAEIPELDAKVLRLNYQNLRYGLVIVLPNSRTGINDLENKLVRTDVSILVNRLWGAEVIVSLPKFKIESTFDLGDSLKEIGLGRIFDDEKSEFPNLIDGKEPLVVSKVIQKAFIEVNEEGAEAAAASGVSMALPISSVYEDPAPVTFKADHPFVFYVVVDGQNEFEGTPLGGVEDTQKIVLFMGKVKSPKSIRPNLYSGRIIFFSN